MGAGQIGCEVMKRLQVRHACCARNIGQQCMHASSPLQDWPRFLRPHQEGIVMHCCPCVLVVAAWMGALAMKLTGGMMAPAAQLSFCLDMPSMSHFQLLCCAVLAHPCRTGR